MIKNKALLVTLSLLAIFTIYAARWFGVAFILVMIGCGYAGYLNNKKHSGNDHLLWRAWFVHEPITNKFYPALILGKKKKKPTIMFKEISCSNADEAIAQVWKAAELLNEN
jgi:hypothetical protein